MPSVFLLTWNNNISVDRRMYIRYQSRDTTIPWKRESVSGIRPSMKFRVQSALFPRQLNLFDISAAITPQRWRHIDSARALNRIREAALLFAIPLLITLLSMWVRIGGISSRTLRFTFLSSLPSSFVLYSWLTRLSRASVSVLASCRGEECGHEELVRCARPLERISSNDLSLVVTKKEELNKLCPWVFHLYSACPGDTFWAENVRCYLSLLYMFHEGWDAVATGLLRTILWRWFFFSPFFSFSFWRREKNARSFLCPVAFRINFENARQRFRRILGGS